MENIIVRPLGGQSIDIDLRLSFSGMLTIDPINNLEPGTTYEVTLNGIQDYMRNPMPEYTFQFTTEGDVQDPPPTIDSFSVSPNPAVAGSQVSLSVTTTGIGALEYRFDDGQGEGLSEWNSNNFLTNTYDPGSYVTRAFVRDSNGRVSSTTAQLTVTENNIGGEDPFEIPAFTNSQLACRPGTDTVWAVNPDNSSVVGISKTTLQITTELQSSVDPRSVVVLDDGTVWVADMKSDRINVYSDSGNLENSIETGYGSAPYGLVANHRSDTVYATLYGSGELLRIEVPTRSESGRISLGPTPRAISVSPDDSRVLVTRFISAENQGEIWEIDAGSFSLVRTIPLYKEDQADTLQGGHGVPNYVASIVISPSGDHAYYASKKDNTDRGILTNSGDLDDDNSVRAIVGVIDLASSEEIYEGRVDLDNRDSPSALVISPNGDYVFVS